jgi:N-acetylglucosamine repressor
MKHVTTKPEHDKAVILSVIRTFGPLSRVDIHDLTQLRPSTISLLVRQLLKEGRIREAGTSNNPIGRKQVLLAMNEDHGYVVGIEVDPDFVVAGVMNLKPEILEVVTEKTYLKGGVRGLIDQLLSCVATVVSEAGFEGVRPQGVALADVGIIDSRAGRTVQSSDIDFWRDVPLRDVFTEACGAPFLIESNTRCRALAERVLGAGEMANEMIFIDYRAGIGAGIFSGGRMIRGHVEGAGEFGHTHVMREGPPCRCGSFGCLDAVAGGSALATKARRAVEEGGVSKVLELAGSVDQITGWTVLQAAALDDKMAVSLIDDMGYILALGISNLVNLFNPSVIVLSSRLEVAGPRLLEQIVRIVKKQSLQYFTDNLTFRYGSLGDRAGVLGAGLMILEHLFEIPALKPPKFMVDAAAAPFLMQAALPVDLRLLAKGPSAPRPEKQ